MSAIVTSDRDEDWYTNSRTWSIILEHALRGLEPERRDEYAAYANPVGIDFTLIEGPRRRGVARWLLDAVEALSGPESSRQGWDTAQDRTHLEALAAMLRPMAQA